MHSIPSLDQLVSLLNGKCLQDSYPHGAVSVCWDSRTATPGSLFMALPGSVYNGHDFLEQAYARGVRYFLVSQTKSYNIMPGASIVLVPDTLCALQQLASYHRAQYAGPLLAITGSNGKTIVKDLVAQLLGIKYYATQSPKSYNSQLGVPVSILNYLYSKTSAKINHTYGVFEAGISQMGEMLRLFTILQPTHGLFTNLGTAHDEGFENQQVKLLEKLKLFRSCQKIIYRQDQTEVHIQMQKHYAGRTVTWSDKTDQADYYVQYNIKHNQAEVVLHHMKRTYHYVVPFTDPASLENVTHCIVFALIEEIIDLQPTLQHLKNLPMRLMLKPGRDGNQIIDDTYNNDLSGLEAALKLEVAGNTKTVVLSDLVQTGLPDAELYQQVSQLLQRHHVDRLIGVGSKLCANADKFKCAVKCYENVDQLLLDFPVVRDSVVLIKGARSMALERVVQYLQAQIHCTVLEVDFDIIVENLQVFRKHLLPKTLIMAMLKAGTYGCSSHEVAEVLQHHHIDYFAVAYTDEGVHLRRCGITTPILVMNATEESFPSLLLYDLEPEIYNLEIGYALENFLVQRQASLSVHIKLDTGMHRLGIVKEDLSVLCDFIKSSKSLRVVGVMTHLAASGDARHDSYTHAQCSQFHQMTQQLDLVLHDKPLKHILNSAGVLRFPEYQHDMVRLGIGLYGALYLKQAVSLRTIVSHISTASAGSSIGYDRSVIVNRVTRVATIAIGYADGFRCTLGNGCGHVLIRGQLAPTLGNICMDMTMIDVTEIPNVKVGDEVIIFGPNRPLVDLAKEAGTHVYELLTGVSNRVRRVYITG